MGNDVQVLLGEYNNLWQEKNVHKSSIRKFHNYLTYVATIGSLALALNGLSFQDLIGNDPSKSQFLAVHGKDILNLIFVPFAPVVLITLTFPINDTFHIYTIGAQIATLEKRINEICSKNNLTWEHVVCPYVYGGRRFSNGTKIQNLIILGDVFLLGPAIFVLTVVTSVLGFRYVCKLSTDYVWPCQDIWGYIYLVIVVYMFSFIGYLLYNLYRYIKSDGPLAHAMNEVNLAQRNSVVTTSENHNGPRNGPGTAQPPAAG
jgi:hypothetical protein